MTTTPSEKHEHQHRLVVERKARLDAAPKRSGVDKLRRRELAKSAWWTLTGHLSGQHGVRMSFLGKSWDEVEAHHAALHEACPTHRIHEVGRPECVSEGCEPHLSVAPVLPPYDQTVRDAARRMGSSKQAWAAASRTAR